ncbi:hypothetical protein B0T22DRAFT_445440 [Podospora appendiculata]|uniref:Protein kinase domain-containing protein n=1 Tax=Podospora appendiculata TaxID=314037 RepID=A0AAE0WZ96_9PEZI|nr:hypothetical protein B0T22DRAFT_445440 [Podospora appendiculata]
MTDAYDSLRDTSKIPQISSPDNHDGIWKELPNGIVTILTTILSHVKTFNSVTNFCVPLLEDERGRVAPESLQIQQTEDLLEASMANEEEIMHELEVMGCPKYTESEVQVVSRTSSSYFGVRVDGRACTKRKTPFASAGNGSENGVRGFLNDLKLFNSLRDCQGISRFVGVVLDDSRQHLKGYLYDAPMFIQLFKLSYIAQSRSETIPWSVREPWAKQIAEAVAEVHSRGFVIGALARHNIGVRADGSAILLRLESSKRYLHYDPQEGIPPELRDQDDDNDPVLPELQQQQTFDTRTDVFLLGLLLWFLADHKGTITGSMCLRHVCTTLPRYTCHSRPPDPPLKESRKSYLLEASGPKHGQSRLVAY